jgi:hypothetical protein
MSAGPNCELPPAACEQCGAPVGMYWSRICADCYKAEARWKAEARAAADFDAYAVGEQGVPR